MLGLIGNLSLQELVLIAGLAIVLFGKRLPQVLGQGLAQLRKLRRSLDDLRRETGIDRELNRIGSSFDEVTREARVDDPLRSPAEPHNNPTPPPSPLEASDGPSSAQLRSTD